MMVWQISREHRPTPAARFKAKRDKKRARDLAEMQANTPNCDGCGCELVFLDLVTFMGPVPANQAFAPNGPGGPPPICQSCRWQRTQNIPTQTPAMSAGKGKSLLQIMQERRRGKAVANA